MAVEEKLNNFFKGQRAFRPAGFLKHKSLLELKDHPYINYLGKTNSVIPCFETLNQKNNKQILKPHPLHKSTNLY